MCRMELLSSVKLQETLNGNDLESNVPDVVPASRSPSIHQSITVTCHARQSKCKGPLLRTSFWEQLRSEFGEMFAPSLIYI